MAFRSVSGLENTAVRLELFEPEDLTGGLELSGRVCPKATLQTSSGVKMTVMRDNLIKRHLPETVKVDGDENVILSHKTGRG